VLRLDEPDPLAAWDERMAVLSDYAARLTERRFDAIELRGPGTELTIGLLPTATWSTVDFSTAKGLRHFSNLPSEEVFTTQDPRRASGRVTATKPLALDENASSHIALGNGFPFLVEDKDRERANVSAQHTDFMIGSAELDVDGVTAGGERVPVLRKLTWQL
jgi:aminopeptidase